MIIAGEESGDLHGSSLIKELKILNPEIIISGIGGSRMIADGMKTIYHIKDLAFLGFAEVIRHIPFIKKVQKDLLAHLISEQIKTIVLIDYPGFNLNFAKKIKRHGIKIIYYISPQLWAWGSGRVKKVKRLVDKMLVIFPFEKDFYDKYDVPSIYTGHPLLDQIKSYNFLTKDELINKYNLNAEKEILLILPGSRINEIKKIFPSIIESALTVAADNNLQIVVACSNNIQESTFADLPHFGKFILAKGNTYDFYKYAKAGIIKSGTSTLEAGFFQLPFFVVYSTSWLTYRIAKLLIKVDNIALVNIIAGETIIKEFIQKDINPTNLIAELKKITCDEVYRSHLKSKLEIISKKLGKAGASKNAAQIIHAELNGN